MRQNCTQRAKSCCYHATFWDTLGHMTDLPIALDRPDWSIFDGVADATVIVTPDDGIIRYANPKVFEVLGWNADDLIDRPVELLIPGSLKSRHEAHRSKFLQAPRARAMAPELQLVAVRRGGEEIPVTISLSPLERDGVLYVMAALRDLTVYRRVVDPPSLAPLKTMFLILIVLAALNAAMNWQSLQLLHHLIR